jgi:hypothetical protein
MSHFEDDLRDALRRREPPGGFVDRVMARVPQKRRSWWSLPSLRWVPALAMLLVVLVVAGTVQQRRAERERQEGERAKQELMFALEVTSKQLEATKEKLLRVGGSL